MTPETEKYLLEPWTVEPPTETWPATIMGTKREPLATCISADIAEFLLLAHDIVAGIENGKLTTGRMPNLLAWWARAESGGTVFGGSFLSACRAALESQNA